MTGTRNPLILSMGDPAGIGPEIIAKAWRSLHRDTRHTFIVAGQIDALTKALSHIDQPPPQAVSSIANAVNVFAENLPVWPVEGLRAEPGQPDPKHAPAITNAIESAVDLCLGGACDGLVTAPIAKDILYQSGFNFPGHTEYLGELTAGNTAPYRRGPLMMLMAQDLRVALVTVHMPLKDAVQAVNGDRIAQTAQILHDALIHDFGIKTPRIAMAGLNPHAGENGSLGEEEDRILNPAALILRKQGINITNAQSADTLFHAEARQGYDAVLAMYHDQGLIPVKTLDFHGGVNITLGLPIVRTSPDHGTAFNIAGTWQARADSLIAAIRAARTMADNRKGISQ